MKIKTPYNEGEWFTVPLLDGGFGTGIVARMDGKGIILGYFFGPKWNESPSPSIVSSLHPKKSALVCILGDLGLLEHRWPIIGMTSTWKRDQWPMPAFGYRDLLIERWWKREYDEDSLNLVRQTPISLEEYSMLPRDGLFGYGAIEKVLTRLFSEQCSADPIDH